ncbi:hypothetical protein HAP94_01415 [Acidithiobacillus ferrivorans]|nr:hypothetical protein [Acidithiobacillus ferrivorans]
MGIKVIDGGKGTMDKPLGLRHTRIDADPEMNTPRMRAIMDRAASEVTAADKANAKHQAPLILKAILGDESAQDELNKIWEPQTQRFHAANGKPQLHIVR